MSQHGRLSHVEGLSTFQDLVTSLFDLSLIDPSVNKSYECKIAIFVISISSNIYSTVKPVLSGHSKRRPKMVFKTCYHLMQVKSIDLH